MIAHLSRLALISGTLLIGSCMPPDHFSTRDTNGGKSSFCAIAQNLKNYLGTKVEISARYVSDGKHEEVLEDAACSDGCRIIDIGRRSNFDSVSAFYLERRRICSGRGAIYLCNTSADIEVLGTINLMSGHFVLDVEEVLRHSFDD